MEEHEKILAAMRKAGKALSAGQVSELTGVDRKQIDKIFNDLKKQDKIVSPRRCYWEPK